MPRLILCADDFGLSSAISDTIAGLAAAGRINAISCMAAAPGWRHDSAMLDSLPRSVAIGLHLTLSGETGVTAMPVLAPDRRLPGIDDLTSLAMQGRLPLPEIALEVRAQFERFTEMTGREPDFVDGHQHSHVLPGIRRIVIAATQRHAPNAWLRDCTDKLPAMLKRPFRGKALASAMYATGFARAAARAGLSCNQGFAGHYGFAGDYSALFPHFLRSPGSQHLVMCHPGAGVLADDPIARARHQEAAALWSLPIADIAAAQGLTFH